MEQELKNHFRNNVTREAINDQWERLEEARVLGDEAADLIYEAVGKIEEIARLFPEDQGYLEAYLINHLKCIPSSWNRYDASIERFLARKEEELENIQEEFFEE